jgi:hypothetical protein
MQAWAGYPHAILWAVALTGIILGVLGCAVALFSWRRQRSLQGRLDRLQEAAARERERETKRARLHASLGQQIDISWTLVIRNDRPATASGITVSVNGDPLDRSPLIDQEKLEKIDTETLPGSRQLRLPLVSRDLPDDLVVEVTWSDGSGELGFRKTTFGV